MAEGSWTIGGFERLTVEKAFDRIIALEARVAGVEAEVEDWSARKAPIPSRAVITTYGDFGDGIPVEVYADTGEPVPDLESENSELRLRISDLEEEIQYLREYGNL